MNYIPVNVVTGRKYAQVDENRKSEMERDPHLIGKYRFEAVKQKAPAVAPVAETKKQEDPPKKETAKISAATDTGEKKNN